MMTTLAALETSNVLAQSAGIPNLLWFAILFFIIAIVAYVFGARGVAGMSAGIGRTLMFVFLVLFLVLAILSFARSA